MEPVMPLASPPGTPDDFDLSRIAGLEVPDPIVWLNRLRIRRAYLAGALAIWSFMVLFTLILVILTGSPVVLVGGYGVTIPYLLVCHHYRNLNERIIELHRFCNLEGC